jgi:hypothetical protein
MADLRNARAQADKVKAKIHRRCPHCLRTHVSQGASKPDARSQGETAAVLKAHIDISVKAELIELARREQISVSALVRKIIREWSAANQP